MTDYFALLQEKRRPWLDSEILKSKFFALSAEVHPDRFHNADPDQKLEANRLYAELNAAYNCLKEPRTRLLHLIELETGAKLKDIQQIPAATVDLFMEVSQLCREVDKFLVEKSGATSPLLKVKYFERAMEWADQLSTLQKTITAQRESLETELAEANRFWELAPVSESAGRQSLPLHRFEEIYRLLSYLSRWTQQIQERNLQLTLG